MAEDLDRLAAIAAAQTTVAGKIRALAAAGVPRADIARFLGKRYQHVRNVLEGDAQAGSNGAPVSGYVLGHADVSGVQEQSAADEAPATDDRAFIERRGGGVYWLRIKPDGTLPLPAEFVVALEATPGKRVFTQINDGVVTVMSAEASMERVRAMVRKYIPPGGPSLADELVADRRAEAAREAGND
jgi:hypothetical protein